MTRWTETKNELSIARCTRFEWDGTMPTWLLEFFEWKRGQIFFPVFHYSWCCCSTSCSMLIAELNTYCTWTNCSTVRAITVPIHFRYIFYGQHGNFLKMKMNAPEADIIMNFSRFSSRHSLANGSRTHTHTINFGSPDDRWNTCKCKMFSKLFSTVCWFSGPGDHWGNK